MSSEPDVRQCTTPSENPPPTSALPMSAPILIMDVHELVGWSLTLCLRNEGESAWFCPARSAADVPDIGRRSGPGLFVIEPQLGRDKFGRPIDGLGLITAMHALRWRVLVLTGSVVPEEIGAALDAGASGWIPKTAPFPRLLTLLRATRAGRPITPAGQRRELIARSRNHAAERAQRDTRLSRLSPRELEVLTHLAEGHRAGAIADRFVVSPATVRAQIRAVLRKLEVGSQLEAVALYRETVTLSTDGPG